MDNKQSSTDWVYYSKQVEVYRLTTQNDEFFITISQGEVVKQMLRDADGKDRMIFLNDSTGIRLFLIQSISKVKKRFFELPNSVRQRILQEGEVFTEKELAGFSSEVRQLLPIKRVERLNG